MLLQSLASYNIGAVLIESGGFRVFMKAGFKRLLNTGLAN